MLFLLAKKHYVNQIMYSNFEQGYIIYFRVVRIFTIVHVECSIALALAQEIITCNGLYIYYGLVCIVYSGTRDLRQEV